MVNVPVKFELNPVDVQPVIDALTAMQGAFFEMSKGLNEPLRRLDEIAMQALPLVRCDCAVTHAQHKWWPDVDGESRPSRCDGQVPDLV